MHVKRYRLLIILCLTMVLMAGCGAQGENPYRVDTVVQIPVDPTEPPTEPAAEETEAVTEPETAPEETESKSTSSPKSSGSKASSSSGGKTSSSGNKGSSSGNKGSSSGSSAKATEPKETQPPETVSPVTEPPATEAPTEPPATEAPTEPPYNPSNYSVGSLEHGVLNAINAYRGEAGIPALSMSTKLSGIAALRAEEVMQVWSHSRPDGRDFTSALSDYGYGCGAAAENLVYATDSNAQAMVDKWMSSDSNKSSLLSEGFTTAGIGVYRSGGVTYVACILVG